MRALFSTRVGGFYALDVIRSAPALLSLIRRERRVRPLAHAWVAPLAICLISVSRGFALFLYRRERGASPLL